MAPPPIPSPIKGRPCSLGRLTVLAPDIVIISDQKIRHERLGVKDLSINLNLTAKIKLTSGVKERE